MMSDSWLGTTVSAPATNADGSTAFFGRVPAPTDGTLETAALFPWITITLVTVVAIGYLAIAVNWYFQARLPGGNESKASADALRRLRVLFLFGVVSASALFFNELPWLVWRLYDLSLVVMAAYTWSFIHRMSSGVGQLDERLHQMAEVERAATRYCEIAELLPHMVWTANADGSVDFANRRWREYSGDNRTWLEAVHPDDRGRAFDRWKASITAREPLAVEVRLGGAVGSGGDTRTTVLDAPAAGAGEPNRRATDAAARIAPLIRPRGYRTFVVRATPLVHGQAVKWLGACADVEDQKLLAAEKEMQARQKSFFLNALSHDLRAPLHNIMLNAHLLKMSPQRDDPADEEAVNLIMENAVAAGDLLTRLLDFAKVGGQEQNVIEVCEVGPLIQQLVRRFAPSAAQKGLELRFDERGAGTSEARTGSGAGTAASPGLRVRTDRQKFQRVVGNLIDNAIKYTSRGGITITCAFRDSAVGGAEQAGVGADHPEVCVRVADTGIGIPPENVPYLFDEFYQVNNHERDRSKGFGMGLAICKSLARHIGGDVRLIGTGPGGSCFEVALRGAALLVVTGSTHAADVPVSAGTAAPGPAGAVGAAGAPAAVGAIGADRGGRPRGEAGDLGNPSAAGLCRV